MFFFSFSSLSWCSYTSPTCLSSSDWQRPYTEQMRTYHAGPDVLLHLDVVVFILLIRSGKTPGSEVQLEIF